ncbi:MAG: hypothetical protein ACKVZH_07875 [Blastocatellia bacterium]
MPDGITESLIGSLSQLPDLTVRPISMVLPYKGREVDPRQAGKALKIEREPKTNSSKRLP